VKQNTSEHGPSSIA